MKHPNVRGKETTETLRDTVAEYKKARDMMKSMEILFCAGLDIIAGAVYNPFDCEHRETCIHQTLTEDDIHKCRRGKQPDTTFDMCKDCDIKRCPL